MVFSVCHQCGDLYKKTQGNMIYCEKHRYTVSSGERITIKRETFKKIQNFKQIDQSFDDFINELLDLKFGARLEYILPYTDGYQVDGEKVNDYYEKKFQEEHNIGI